MRIIIYRSKYVLLHQAFGRNSPKTTMIGVQVISLIGSVDLHPVSGPRIAADSNY